VNKAKIAHTLWIVGSYFLEDKEHKDVRVFDNFPLLAFFSPDEDSGKTRALDVQRSCLQWPLMVGTYTASAMLTEIDERYPTLITSYWMKRRVLAPVKRNPYMSNCLTTVTNVASICSRHLMEKGTYAHQRMS